MGKPSLWGHCLTEALNKLAYRIVVLLDLAVRAFCTAVHALIVSPTQIPTEREREREVCNDSGCLFVWTNYVQFLFLLRA